MSVPEDIRIVPAPRALKDRIKELARTTFEEHNARQPFAFPGNLLQVSLFRDIDRAFEVEGKQLDESPVALAAFLGNDFAGYVLLSDWAREDGPDMPSVTVEDIRVLEEHRGRGVGRALLQAVQDRATAQGWDNVTATIWAGNPESEALFNAAGFTEQSKTYRFGPSGQARDYPDPPRPGLRQRISTWLVLGLAMLGGAVMVVAIFIGLQMLFLG